MQTYLPIREIERLLPAEAVLDVSGLPYPRVASGKVRDIFDVGDELLIIASDRLSAFDVVLPDGIPGKGILLNQVSLFWFEKTAKIIRNHLVSNHTERLAEALKGHEELIPRAMLVRKLQPLPIEAVVRQYLAGSGWKHYLRHGNLFGLPVPAGLRESARLPIPLFTPTTKASVGEHDMPMTHEEGAELVGESLFESVRQISLKLFAMGASAAKENGLLLADTKFEFGIDPDTGFLYLIDEILTPDSSRYWPADRYEPGHSQVAFDKQYVRDYLETLDWDKTAPGPSIPAEIIHQTRERYLETLRCLLPNA